MSPFLPPEEGEEKQGRDVDVKQNVWFSSGCKHNIGFVEEMAV